MKLTHFVVIVLTSTALSAQNAKPAQTQPATQCGPLASQVLRCPRFSFTYKVPYGWVDRTSEMSEEAQPEAAPTGNNDQAAKPGGKSQPEASSSGSETLLAVFERPPGAPGDTIDSAAIIAAEPLANYHGIKTAADYFGAITELAEQRGFKAIGDPYTFSIGAKQLVRGDFSKPRNKLTMYQTSLAMIEKGYIVSFTFIGGSEDEMDELIANLNLGTRRASHAGSK